MDLDLGLICPLCGERVSFFKWCLDFAGEEWAVCSVCGGRTDQTEIDAANREDIPMLAPIKRKVHVPEIPEWRDGGPTRIDVGIGSPHPGRPGSDWLRDLIDGVFEHADRIEIDTWSFEENAA